MRPFMFLIFSLFFLPLSWGQIETATDNSGAEKRMYIRRQVGPIEKRMDSLYQQRITEREINGIYIPRDLYDCFRVLDGAMEDDFKEYFMSLSDEEVDARTHGSLGLWMKHRWQLMEGSRLSDYFRKMGVPHPEYAVGIIIQSYHRKLHQRDLGVKELVEKFQKIWAKKQAEEAKALLGQ
ncbi:hypothetical protein SapgrDRAFT_0143 [Saprospira grandis DSM 2844]|uniref:DUF6794 domain-containing protein n=1 Tax=Saprospira grandis DSM 2844 TaxID=694433 RepID=J0P3B2_9BACT|nr:DUF6794 domain-containing protein [Saprospira grandis]EJF51902.1 hypothetical protein SapgrDRAFT_0143 [Saprospira grandis DSM 2844]